MATIRQQRVADLLFEELSIMISNELEDPRISYVDVTKVVISRDLRNAKAFVYHRDDEVSSKDVLHGLRDATPYLRRQIAQRCGLRMTPEILFYYDDTPERAARIDELLNQIAQDRQGQEAPSISESTAERKVQIDSDRKPSA